MLSLHLLLFLSLLGPISVKQATGNKPQMMGHQCLSVGVILLDRPKKTRRAGFSPTELQENWDSTSFNRVESSLEGKRGISQTQETPKIVETKGWQIRLHVPLVTSCRLAALLRHGNYKARKETDEQRKAFKYTLGNKHYKEFAHILNNSSLTHFLQQVGKVVRTFIQCKTIYKLCTETILPCLVPGHC